MIRHGDANQKIRAIEGLQRMRSEEHERAIAAQHNMDPLDTVRMLLGQCGEVGALVTVGLHFANEGTTKGAPFGRQLFQITRATFPEAWQRMLQGLKPEFQRCVPELEAMAEGPAPTIKQILDADSRPKANGKQQTEGTPT